MGTVVSQKIETETWLHSSDWEAGPPRSSRHHCPPPPPPPPRLNALSVPPRHVEKALAEFGVNLHLWLL